MHRSSNISQTFEDDTLASETRVQPWLPQVCCHSLDQNLNQFKLNQNNPCNKSKSIPIIDPETRMEIVVNSPKNLDQAADRYRIQNKSHRNASVDTRGIHNLRGREINSSLMEMKISENVDSSSRPRPFECSTPAGDDKDGSDVVRKMSQMNLMSDNPSHQPAGDVKEGSNIPRRMSQVSLMLGKPLSQPRGVAGSVGSSFSRRSCRSRTGGKERTLLLGKLNSRLAGLEEDGAQVIVGLEMLENKVKALVEEAKLTAEEMDSEGDAMDKYSAMSQYLVQVEDEITMISASLNQWQDFSSDSEEVDDNEVSNVEVIYDENMAKEVILGGNEENCSFVNEKVEVLSSIAAIIDIGNKAKDVIFEDKVENGGLENTQKEKESIKILNIADPDKDNTVILEGNMENGSQVNKQMETVEIHSNSSDGNFISFADLINGKEMLDINENIDTNENNIISYTSPTQIRKLQNVNSQISADLKLKFKARGWGIESREDGGLINLDSIRNNICGLAYPYETVDNEHMADLVEEAVVDKPELKDEEDELELVNEISSDSLGSTWEDGSTRPFHEDVTEKSKLPAMSSGETKLKVREWLNSKHEEVNTSSPPTSSVKSFRAKLRPKKDIESKNMTVNSDMLTGEVVKMESLRILEDENSSFLFKLSTIENPGKFFIHPVQDEMAYLTQIHNEIKNHPRKIPDERLVLRDTIWSMFNLDKQRWCRVRVESRSSTSASVRYIDFGTSEERVELWFLRHLPDTWVRQLPGLAVQCNLGCCSPVGGDWDAESTAALQKLLGDDKEHRAVTVGESNGSLDLLLLMKGKIVNQQMVECGFASSQVTDYFTQFREILGLCEM